MTMLALADRPDQSVLDEMKRGCEQDSGVRWHGAVPRDVDLWLPGRLDREPTSPKDLAEATPYDSFWGNDEVWLSRGIARALYVNIKPALGGRGAGDGPSAGEPDGVYRFQLAPASDPRCVARREQLMRDNPPDSIGYAYAQDSTRRCAVYAYVGPFDGEAGAATFVRFSDAALRPRGLYRDGERLFIDGQLRAGFTMYWAINPSGSSERQGQWGIEACRYGPLGHVWLFPPDGETT